MLLFFFELDKTTTNHPLLLYSRGLHTQSDQARQEEERMARMFGRRAVQQQQQQPQQPSSTPTAASGATAGRAAAQKARIPEVIAASEIVAEINAARTNPAAYAKRIRETFLPRYKGKTLRAEDATGGAALRETEEGAAAAEDAAAWIATREACPPVTLNLALSRSARDICVDQALSGATGSTMSDGTDLGKRVERYGNWRGKIGESLVYGALCAADAVFQFAVDDGVAGRHNKQKLFDPSFLVVGVNCGPHKLFGNALSVVYAQEFAEGTAAAAHQSHAAASAQPQRISESAERACYNADLGPANGATPQNASVVKKGAFIVLKTRRDGELAEQRWRLPFACNASSISVKLNAGRITLSIAKEPVADESKKAGVVVLDNHHIDARPSAASSSRPEVKLGPKATDSITTTVEPAAVATLLTVKLTQEEAARSLLVFDFEFTEKGTDETGPFTKTVRSGQTVRLPFVVGRENVHVESATATLVRIVVTAPPTAPYNPDAPEEPIPFTA